MNAIQEFVRSTWNRLKSQHRIVHNKNSKHWIVSLTLAIVFYSVYCNRLYFTYNTPVIFEKDEFIGFNITRNNGQSCSFVVEGNKKTFSFHYMIDDSIFYILTMKSIVISILYFFRIIMAIVYNFEKKREWTLTLNEGEIFLCCFVTLFTIFIFTWTMRENILYLFAFVDMSDTFWIYSILSASIGKDTHYTVCNNYTIHCSSGKYNCGLMYDDMNVVNYTISTWGNISALLDKYTHYFYTSVVVDIFWMPAVCMIVNIVFFSIIGFQEKPRRVQSTESNLNLALSENAI